MSPIRCAIFTILIFSLLAAINYAENDFHEIIIAIGCGICPECNCKLYPDLFPSAGHPGCGSARKSGTR